MISASGMCRSSARRMAWQISMEDMVPLKESGIRIHLDIGRLLFRLTEMWGDMLPSYRIRRQTARAEER